MDIKKLAEICKKFVKTSNPPCCLGCGFERFDRIAADDDFDLVLSLPALPPRTSREVKAKRLQGEVGKESDKDKVARVN